MSSPPARGEGPTVRPLIAPRELEILRLVADGRTDNEIAGQLHISPRTVQNHLTRIRAMTGLGRRPELARWAVEHAIARPARSRPSPPLSAVNSSCMPIWNATCIEDQRSDPPIGSETGHADPRRSRSAGDVNAVIERGR